MDLTVKCPLDHHCSKPAPGSVHHYCRGGWSNISERAEATRNSVEKGIFVKKSLCWYWCNLSFCRVNSGEWLTVHQLSHLILYLKVDELKVKSIFEFDEEFDIIRELISPKTLFAVDDTLNSLQEVKKKLMQRLDFLLNKGNQEVEGQEELNAR